MSDPKPHDPEQAKSLIIEIFNTLQRVEELHHRLKELQDDEFVLGDMSILEAKKYRKILRALGKYI